MAERFRFGIIGCGVIGKTHAEAIVSLPEAELVAVADVVFGRAQALAQRYGLSAYADPQEMLTKEQLDVVAIGSPSGMHGEHACLAMRAGSHVIVEKPMEITSERMAEMLRVQAETGRKMAVNSQHR